MEVRSQRHPGQLAPHINSKIYSAYIANKTKFKKSLYSTYKFGPYLLPYRKLLFLKNNIRKIISKKDAQAGGLYIYRGINAEKFSKMINRVRSLSTLDKNDNIFSMYAFPISRIQEKGKITFTGNRKIDYFNLFEIKNNFIFKIQRVLKKKVNSLLNRNKE